MSWLKAGMEAAKNVASPLYGEDLAACIAAVYAEKILGE